jgi:DNA-binding PadR family transcriptional regulator
MTTERLTPTSYIVLGLVRFSGSATPYELKQAVAASVGHFWSLPHSQLYAEPGRLAEEGYLSEDREQGGRRRKRYALTPKGERALDEWLARSGGETYELRDPALLKLFFGGDPHELARVQLETHERQLAEYERMHDAAKGFEPGGPLLALEAGIEHARASIRYWKRILRG